MTKITQDNRPASPENVGPRFERLVEIMRILRSPEGCSWDREQTFASLRSFVLEEAYEVVAAIDGNNRAELCEELGDLLLEIVFVAQIASEAGDFTIADATEAIIAKLIRRHPHIFGDKTDRTLTATDVKEQWERIKSEERAEAAKTSTPTSLLDGLPEALPSLLRASRLGARTANAGFDWNTAEDVVEKMHEELTELQEAIEAGDLTHSEEELGDVLFTIANLARKLRIEPESALRAANDKFTRRFQTVEQQLADRAQSIFEASPEELEREWQAVKQNERRRTQDPHSKSPD